ncbi:MAG: orotidine-5'-phosphate decarboxylase [Alphaproteobacteria bacterium]|nr:orotidine-5'-phosphate decarboxylase [Alphaproteobacteria bacterium]
MTTTTNSLPRIFCAIDTPDLTVARTLVDSLPLDRIGIKCGLEFFSARGTDGIERLLENRADARLFLDLKFHDIPNTVAGAVHAVSNRLHPAYINVHASGGLEMMRAARDSCAPGTKLLAVTVLTSLDDTSLEQVGQNRPAAAQVERLALLAREADLDGVVCSSHEIETLRKACGNDFALMVPGIRPAGADVQDQKRVMTPREALAKGATHLVIGRPITKAGDPGAAARAILDELP